MWLSLAMVEPWAALTPWVLPSWLGTAERLNNSKAGIQEGPAGVWPQLCRVTGPCLASRAQQSCTHVARHGQETLQSWDQPSTGPSCTPALEVLRRSAVPGLEASMYYCLLKVVREQGPHCISARFPGCPQGVAAGACPQPCCGTPSIWTHQHCCTASLGPSGKSTSAGLGTATCRPLQRAAFKGTLHSAVPSLVASLL